LFSFDVISWSFWENQDPVLRVPLVFLDVQDFFPGEPERQRGQKLNNKYFLYCAGMTDFLKILKLQNQALFLQRCQKE